VAQRAETGYDEGRFAMNRKLLSDSHRRDETGRAVLKKPMNSCGCIQMGLWLLLVTAVGAQVEPGDPVWEYRSPRGVWTTESPATVKWPTSWRTYTPWEYATGSATNDDPRSFQSVPTAMTLNGVSACRASLPAYGPGILDLTVGQGAPRTGLWAYVFASVKVERDQEVVMHTTASGPSEFWLDGQPVPTPLRLTKGEHLLAGRVGSGEREWNLAGCFLPVGTEARRVKPSSVAPLRLPPLVAWPTNDLARRLPATVALVGDPQSGGPWRGIAGGVQRARVDALFLVGDLVVDGLSVDKWNQTFLAPALDTLTNLPWRAVIGNHDRRASVFEQLGGARWSCEVGGALFVGVDGGLDWSPGSANTKWLENTLAGSSSQFKFVLSHYPAYSSRNHGKLAADGLVLERSSRVARTQIVPVLEKHRVTAMFSGHDHGYERSELPSGLAHIVTAGGGAGVYPKFENGRANPHSTVMVDKHHYGLLRIERDKVVFTAVALDGQTIDTRTWTLVKPQ
jgi:hypothetical protein